MLRDVVTNDNTASDVWADTAYRSRSDEAWLRSTGRVSRVYPKKPRGEPMPARTARADAARSTIRAASSMCSPARFALVDQAKKEFLVHRLCQVLGVSQSGFRLEGSSGKPAATRGRLRGRQKQRFKRTTDSEHAWPIAPNIIDQDFTATAPNQK